MFRYVGFGLAIASDFEIPELCADPSADLSSERNVDLKVEIVELLPVPRVGGGDTTFPPDDLVFDWGDVAFRAQGGGLVQIWESPGFDRNFSRAALLGLMVSVILYQRRLWPVHVSAVMGRGGAWLFTGASGAGKSTLAAWLHAFHKYQHLGDDLAAIGVSDEGWSFCAGPRSIRLMQEAALKIFGDQTARALGPTLSADGKVRIRLADWCPPKNTAVAGLVVIRDAACGEIAALERLYGWRAVEAVRHALYRPFNRTELRSAADTLAFCTGVVKSVPVYWYSRRRDFSAFEDEAAPLLDVLR